MQQNELFFTGRSSSFRHFSGHRRSRNPYSKSHICIGCGISFVPRKRDYRRFHSRECAYEFYGKTKWIGKLCGILSRIKECAICGIRIVRAGSCCSDECYAEHKRREYRRLMRHYRPIREIEKSCADCNSRFTVKYIDSHDTKIRCQKCQRKRDRRNHGHGSNEQRAKRAGVIYQYIRALDVFGRDGWRCHICKRRTPPKLRGTFHPRAPELDHIIPLALGGSHTYENVKCCCRECNIAKGARPIGQSLLFGMIPTASVAYKRLMTAG